MVPTAAPWSGAQVCRFPRANGSATAVGCILWWVTCCVVGHGDVIEGRRQRVRQIPAI